MSAVALVGKNNLQQMGLLVTLSRKVAGESRLASLAR